MGVALPLRISVGELDRATADGSVAERLFGQMLFELGRRVSPGEKHSWERSIPVITEDLVAAELGQVEVLLEYQLPLTSQRADVVLAGVHPTTGRPSYVIVELKQWSAATPWEGDEHLVEVPGWNAGPQLHPSRQVSAYCTHLVDFVRALDGDTSLIAGAAYLHNATRPESVAELRRYPDDPSAQLFMGYERAAFRIFLKSRLATGVSGTAAADLLLRSGSAPSRQLLTLAAAEIRDREQFTLQGNQQLAVDLVMHEVRAAARQDNKAVVIVSGGPGSGKSVIALSLLGDLSRAQKKVMHATGSRSFTQTLRQVAGHRAPRVRGMFKYFNQFVDAEPNDLDVLILDEAHRIRQSSVNRYTRADLRTDRLQLDELLAAARVPVFLLDENQVVRPGEMGSVDSVRTYAESRGLRVHVVSLPEQFRCGGSSAYVLWLERLLGISVGEITPWAGTDRFVLESVDSPQELEDMLAARRTEGYSARMSAGYCWPWSDPRGDGSLVSDVSIGDWARPWNVKGERRVGDAPPAALWASDPAGFGQVGCVYTAQGFEYDWNGVILGPDIVWRKDRFITRREHNKDPDLRSSQQVSDAYVGSLVRNVYKVLLTRGMIGTLIYSTDAETRERLHTLTAGRP